LAHWIHHRDSREAIKAALDCHTAYLIRAINFFKGPDIFPYDIGDSLVDEPTCDYDRAVQARMQRRLADVLVNDGDWSRLPSQFQEPSEDRDFDFCLRHQHGNDKACYYDGKIVKSG
jgi:hypothetical protein